MSLKAGIEASRPAFEPKRGGHTEEKSEDVFAGFHYTQHKKLIRKDLKKMIKENH